MDEGAAAKFACVKAMGTLNADARELYKLFLDNERVHVGASRGLRSMMTMMMMMIGGVFLEQAVQVGYCRHPWKQLEVLYQNSYIEHNENKTLHKHPPPPPPSLMTNRTTYIPDCQKPDSYLRAEGVFVSTERLN